MYALKTIMYLLNRVPSRTVQRTLLNCRQVAKLSLRHLHVWSCHAKIIIYNSQEKKLDTKAINGYIIHYPEKSKGYMFYCPTHSTRNVEIGNSRFLKNG